MTAPGGWVCGQWSPAHLPQPCVSGTVSPAYGPSWIPWSRGGVHPGWGSKPQLEPKSLHPVPELRAPARGPWEAGLGPAGGVDGIPV